METEELNKKYKENKIKLLKNSRRSIFKALESIKKL